MSPNKHPSPIVILLEHDIWQLSIIETLSPINKFGGYDNLQKTIDRDKLKKTLCEKNGVKLYYIKYDDDIISETLKILKENGI